jgi:hypothetical protein
MRTSPVVEIEVAVQRLSQLMAVALYLILMPPDTALIL